MLSDNSDAYLAIADKAKVAIEKHVKGENAQLGLIKLFNTAVSNCVCHVEKYKQLMAENKQLKDEIEELKAQLKTKNEVSKKTLVEPKPKQDSVESKPKSKPKSKIDVKSNDEEVAELKKTVQKIAEKVNNTENKLANVTKSLEINNQYTAMNLAATTAMIGIMQNSNDPSLSESTNAIFGNNDLLSLTYSDNNYITTGSGLTLF